MAPKIVLASVIGKFLVLNFKRIAIHVHIENMSDEVSIYVYLHF